MTAPAAPSFPTQLMVALDFSAVDPARRLVESLADLPVTYKVGSELFLAGGPQWVERLVAMGRPVFLDLKWHDIPNTVSSSVRLASDLGVRFATLHLSGGKAMVEAAVQEARARSGGRLTLLGVSVLTSFSDTEWSELGQVAWGAGKSAPPRGDGCVGHAVSRLVKAGVEWGIPGVVCSAHEVQSATRSHPDLFTVVPGIRPGGSAAADQARVKTPLEARNLGARAIVVGRPITGSERPREVVLQILRDLGHD
ncbi:MAG: orotidine-5'-phosphate decarboxylase [Bdellovibrionales bacterium]|nr:orotidine-5'-phosphate decarboxylase [Bdellovibrionales bacterium]